MVTVGAEALDRCDLFILERAHLRLARPHGHAVDVNGTCSAQAEPAAESSAGKPQIVAKMPEERHSFVAVECSRSSVDSEIDHARIISVRRSKLATP
jgi:hypothetical protein